MSTIDEVLQSSHVPLRQTHHGTAGSLGLSILWFGPDASQRREGLLRSVSERRGHERLQVGIHEDSMPNEAMPIAGYRAVSE